MVTANQSATIQALRGLQEAQENLIKIRSLVCFDRAEVDAIDRAVRGVGSIYQALWGKINSGASRND